MSPHDVKSASVRHQRKQHHSTAGKRSTTWLLTQEEPYPKRSQDHFQERDQARFGCWDQARPSNEENKSDAELPDLGAFEDFRAVIHVHAEDADHTKGTREQVLAAARKTGVRVVLFTDHRGPQAGTWHELRDGVLFLAGSEEGDGKRE